VLGEISSGSSNDLAGATQLATRMVREFGMSPRLGPVGFSEDGPQYLGAQQLTTRQYAEETQRVIDEEVTRPTQGRRRSRLRCSSRAVTLSRRS
jgi:cell division protease FtsH